MTATLLLHTHHIESRQPAKPWEAFQIHLEMADTQSIDDGNSLEKFKIPSLPPDFYYIPNFISREEEESILQKVCRPRST